MALKAKKLTAQQAQKVLRRFYKAHGPDVMRDAYWWESVSDATVAPGEHVWAFYDYIVHTPVPNPIETFIIDGQEVQGQPTMRVDTTRELVGWGTCQIQLDVADDDEAVLAAGVFPEFQRQGYRVKILDWMCNWARKQGANYAITNTNNCNEAQIRRKKREAEAGGPWLEAGGRTIPAPGYTIFVRDLNQDAE